MYFVLGENAGYKYPTSEKIMNGWNPYLFSGSQTLANSDREKFLGIEFCVWSDKPDSLTTDEIIFSLEDLLGSINKKIEISK